jgi:hypothetical protein
MHRYGLPHRIITDLGSNFNNHQFWEYCENSGIDEYKREEFTMHAMLVTTINDNPAHRNLSGQSKRKGAACPHCLEDTCAVWLRHSKKYVFMEHCRFLGKKHPYWAMDCTFNGESQGHQNYRGVTQTDLKNPWQKKEMRW